MGQPPMNDIDKRLHRLEAEADARRARISSDMDELSWRMKPANLLAEAGGRLMSEVDRATDALIDMAGDMVDDAAGFARAHARTIGAGTALALLAGAGVWFASRRLRKKPVPLYDAYHLEDFDMNEPQDSLRKRAAGRWTKVKADARTASDKAGETYYSARSRAASLSTEAREKARHASEVAREKAHHAGEAARETSQAAGQWVRQQPQENPIGTVAAVAAIGLLAGLLLPARNR